MRYCQQSVTLLLWPGSWCWNSLSRTHPYNCYHHKQHVLLMNTQFFITGYNPPHSTPVSLVGAMCPASPDVVVVVLVVVVSCRVSHPTSAMARGTTYQSALATQCQSPGRPSQMQTIMVTLQVRVISPMPILKLAVVPPRVSLHLTRCAIYT